MAKAAGKKLKTTLLQAFYFIMGVVFYVLALRLFFVENQIAAGGVSGIATILNYVISSISVGNFVFLLNCPLLILAAVVMGWRYTVKTLLGMTVFVMTLNLAEVIPVATPDRFVASVFGGILYSLGAVSLLYAKASTGGTDLLCRVLIRKYRNISLGKMFLMIDGFCVILAVIAYGNLEAGVYALTSIVVFSYSTDRIISGFNVADICYVITSQPPEELSQRIMEELHVGVTLQEGLGMYEKTKRYILMVVIRPREIQRLKTIIEKHDPKAFLVVAWASEVMGGGFKHVSDKS